MKKTVQEGLYNACRLHWAGIYDAIKTLVEQGETPREIETEILRRSPALRSHPMLASMIYYTAQEIAERRAQAAQKAQPKEGIDYLAWVQDQPWPEGSRYVTMDKQGGCCWWRNLPALRPSFCFGWQGDLVERFYDPAAPMTGANWKNSLKLREVIEAMKEG